MQWTSGAQNIAKKRYMKCTFCLGLVGALYPSKLELPVISWLVQVSPIFSAFTESFLELLQVYSYSVYVSLLLKCLFCYGLL